MEVNKMNYKRPIFIAELCCNHMGSVDLAKLMIDLAKNLVLILLNFKKEIYTLGKKENLIFIIPRIQMLMKLLEKHIKNIENF